MESELCSENPTLPVTVTVAPGVETLGQFNTRGSPGVERVKLNTAEPVTPQVIDALAPLMAACPLTVARLNVPTADGSKGP
jgi:hypothetical protein